MIAVKHIKSVDGFTGCYRGLFPKVCANVACIFATEKILSKIDQHEKNERRRDRQPGRSELFEESSQPRVSKKMSSGRLEERLDADEDIDIDEDEEAREEDEEDTKYLLNMV